MKTVLIGASSNPSRYAYLAASSLAGAGIDFVPMGIKGGIVAGKNIVDLRQRPQIMDVDTVTLYIGPKRQPEWYDYIISLRPRRVIFNPGAENPEFEALLDRAHIETLQACTIVMVRTGQYA